MTPRKKVESEARIMAMLAKGMGCLSLALSSCPVTTYCALDMPVMARNSVTASLCFFFMMDFYMSEFY